MIFARVGAWSDLHHPVLTWLSTLSFQIWQLREKILLWALTVCSAYYLSSKRCNCSFWIQFLYWSCQAYDKIGLISSHHQKSCHSLLYTLYLFSFSGTITATNAAKNVLEEDASLASYETSWAFILEKKSWRFLQLKLWPIVQLYVSKSARRSAYRAFVRILWACSIFGRHAFHISVRLGACPVMIVEHRSVSSFCTDIVTYAFSPPTAALW